MTCECCHRRPGVVWRPVRSDEGWTVTRVLCPECAGLRRPPPRHLFARQVVDELGWALLIILAAFPVAVITLYLWEVAK